MARSDVKIEKTASGWRVYVEKPDGFHVVGEYASEAEARAATESAPSRGFSAMALDSRNIEVRVGQLVEVHDAESYAEKRGRVVELAGEDVIVEHQDGSRRRVSARCVQVRMDYLPRAAQCPYCAKQVALSRGSLGDHRDFGGACEGSGRAVVDFDSRGRAVLMSADAEGRLYTSKRAPAGPTPTYTEPLPRGGAGTGSGGAPLEVVPEPGDIPHDHLKEVAAKSDAELQSMISDESQGYGPAEVWAARKELARRGKGYRFY
jgi:hypothetical protein